jgi:hypothetical protein
VPAGGGGPAHTEPAGDLRLGKSLLQVLRGEQAPVFHFIASEHARSGCFHIFSRGIGSQSFFIYTAKTFYL